MPKDSPTEPAKKMPTKSEFVLGFSAETPAAEVVKKAEETGLTITPAHVHTIRSQAKRAAAASKGAAKPTASKKATSKKTAPKARKVEKAAATAPEARSAVAPQTEPAAAPKKPEKAASKAKPARAPKPKAAKKAARKGRSTAKADFVRSLPTTMPVREVIEAAKQKGIALSDTYVYLVRAELKKTAPPKAQTAVAVQSVVPEQAAQVTPAPVQRPRPAVQAPLPPVPTPEMVFVRLALDLGLQKARDLLAAVDEKLPGLVASIK